VLRLSVRNWITLRFEPRDLWVGVFWDVRPASYGTAVGHVSADLHVYVCLVPCFPVHFIRAWRVSP
jgi:hypothetical protein